MNLAPEQDNMERYFLQTNMNLLLLLQFTCLQLHLYIKLHTPCTQTRTRK